MKKLKLPKYSKKWGDNLIFGRIKRCPRCNKQYIRDHICELPAVLTEAQKVKLTGKY